MLKDKVILTNLVVMASLLCLLFGLYTGVGLNGNHKTIEYTSPVVKTQPVVSQELRKHTIVLDTCWDCRVQGTLPSWAFNQQAFDEVKLK